MSRNPLFSSYSQGENRITSTILSVFERLNSSVVEFILQDIMEDSEIELLKYQNQPGSKKDGSIPDALIKGSFEYYIETKIKHNSIREKQIIAHLKKLKDNAEDSRLLVITPDAKEPKELEKVNDDRLYWVNFEKLFDSLNRTINTEGLLLSEREKYLIGELKGLIEVEGLIPQNIEDQVLLIPAKNAIKSYHKYFAYICQPNRSFRPSGYLAFYYQNKIDKYIPEILGYIEDVTELQIREYLDSIVEVRGEKKELIERFEKLFEQLNSDKKIVNNKIIILSDINDQRTIILDNEIINDKQSESGRLTAFVQGQRYISLKKMRKEKYTSNLE